MPSRYIDPTSITLDPTSIISFVVATNPRKAGTRGHAFYPRYTVGHSIRQILAAAKRDHVGDAPAHIRWDLSRGTIRVDNQTAVRTAVITNSDRATDNPFAKYAAETLAKQAAA